MAKRKDEDLELKKKKFENIAGNLEEISADEFLKQNFLPYAWNYNLDRSLVDETGLKPVQRRILYTMYEGGLSPTANRSKVATIAGKILAYHPHGNVSVEDALKNLARPHVFRVPLIDGKGSFGVPGAPGSAARYIEARLNKAAWINVEDIAEKAVRMMPNYDDTTEEPTKIPVKWPVSIINGGSGIAVGYSSNMPSHNPTEIMNALIEMVKNEDISDEKLEKIILGPDFNMGGEITSNDGIISYLRTGSGTFKIRGKYTITPTTRGSSRIEFYEIPYGTYPEKILEEINKKSSEKGLFKDIYSCKDLSDLRHPIRIVIDTKPATNPKKVVQDLFKNTSLETNFSANITTIADNMPQQLSMKKLLYYFIDFRKTCIKNKSHYGKKKREDKLHLSEGLVKILLDIDKAIAIIRSSESSKEASQELQQTFSIDEKQAEHVLSLQLRRLTKMDSMEIKNEIKKIQEEIDYLNNLIINPETLKEYLIQEFEKTKEIIGDERKTTINNISTESLLEQEKNLANELKNINKNLDCYITLFANGTLLKTMEPFTYKLTDKKLSYSPIIDQFKTKTQNHIIIVNENGIAHKIPSSYLIENNNTTTKELGLNLSKIIAIGKVEIDKEDIGLALGTELGEAKIVKPDYPNKDEFSIFTLGENDKIINGKWLDKDLSDTAFVSITSDSNILIYNANSIRPTGISAGGVRSQKLKDNTTKIIFFGWIKDLNKDNIIISQTTQTIKYTLLSEIPPKGKGSQGVALHKFKKDETKLINAFVGDKMIICSLNTNNVIMPPPVSRRATTGVDLPMRVEIGLLET